MTEQEVQRGKRASSHHKHDRKKSDLTIRFLSFFGFSEVARPGIHHLTPDFPQLAPKLYFNCSNSVKTGPRWLFRKKVKESRYENLRNSLERNSRFVRNFVPHVSRLAGTRSILASFAQAQRPAVRLLLQLLGLEAFATTLQLAPIRALPDRNRQYHAGGQGKMCAPSGLIRRETRINHPYCYELSRIINFTYE
jgi:hypothetical protein